MNGTNWADVRYLDVNAIHWMRIFFYHFDKILNNTQTLFAYALGFNQNILRMISKQILLWGNFTKTE